MSSVAPAKRGTHPLLKVILGVILIAFFVLGSVLHIQTSEAFFRGGSVVGLAPNLAILMQPYQLLQGKLSPVNAEMVMWGWGIELVFLICVVGFEIAHESVRNGSKSMAEIFRTGAIVLILFDGYTDFMYGNLASGFWGQLAFAAITSFIVFFFGTIGLRLVESAIQEMMR